MAALAVAGAALAVVITRNGQASSSTQTVVTVQQASHAPSTASGDATTVSTNADTTPTQPASPGSGAGRVVADEHTRLAIQQVLYQHHDDIVNGDYRAAWDLLSQRKQAQKLREDGYGGWVAAQATLRPYLDPTGVHASIQALDPSTGVAQVMVTGMTWSKPGSHCSQWSGITWMKYEDGTWRYDPGYSTTPERERAWKSRYSELLGGTCSPPS